MTRGRPPSSWSAAGETTRGPESRVLFVSHWYPSPREPLAGIFVREQARAVATAHDVVVLVIEATGAIDRRIEVHHGLEDGLQVVRVRHRPGRLAALRWVPAAVRAAVGLRRAGFDPDVVHGHVYAAGLLAVLIGRALGRPTVVSEHFSALQRGSLSALARMTARAAYRGATIVAPVSDSLRRAIEPLAPHAHFRVVPNVVDTDVFHPGPPEERTQRLLFVGLLDEVKNPPAAMRALAGLGRPQVGLDVVGGGPRRAEYERLAQELGIADQVAFHGPLDKAAVAERMRRAAVLVLPSRTETFGVVVIEAMASGLPVVGTHVGALPELVDESVGRLVDPADTPALTSALADVLDNRVRYDSQRLARRARDRYGMVAVARDLGDVYDEARRMRAQALLASAR